MYKIILIIVIFLFYNSSFAQTYAASPENGYSSLYKNIREQLGVNANFTKYNCSTHINLIFWVGENGKVSDVKIIFVNCEEYYMNINKLSDVITTTKWKAACENGKFVKQKIALPIRFEVKE